MSAAPARRCLIIYNPTAGRFRRRRLRAVLAALREAGCVLEVQPTGGPGDAARLAAAADPALVDVVVAAGGDGTVNEVVNGLGDGRLPLALLPLGTANVLAVEIGLAGTAEAIAATIAHGEARPVSLGCANGRRFVQMAGIGVDAHVVAAVGPRLKRWLGRAAYGLMLLREIRRFAFPVYRVTIDGTTVAAASVIVANGRYYAGRFVCAPAADLASPELQVCLFERGGRRVALGYALALFTGRLVGRRDYRVVPAREVAIAGPAGDPVHGDGEILTCAEVAISCLPQALRLVFPPAAPGRPGARPPVRQAAPLSPGQGEIFGP